MKFFKKLYKTPNYIILPLFVLNYFIFHDYCIVIPILMYALYNM